MKRWRGLQMLVQDAVEHGSRAVEKLQREAVRRPFAILESIPGIDAPAAAIHAVHDLVLTTTHGGIRLANKVVAVAAQAVLETLEDDGGDPPA